MEAKVHTLESKSSACENTIELMEANINQKLQVLRQALSSYQEVKDKNQSQKDLIDLNTRVEALITKCLELSQRDSELKFDIMYALGSCLQSLYQ